MGTISHFKSNTGTNDPVNTYLVEPQDWNSAHLYTLQDGVSISGNNTAGVLAPISSGTCYLAGGNNVTLSQQGNSITISYPPPTLSQWPKVMPAILQASTYFNSTTTAAASASNYSFSYYFVPAIFECAVAFSHIRVPISLAAGAGTGSATQIFFLGIYSNNASTLSLDTNCSVCGGLYVSQNSTTAVTYSVWTASTGSNTTGQGAFAGIRAVSVTSTQGNFIGYISGPKNLAFPLAASTTLTAGNYWLAIAYGSESSGANVFSNAGILQSLGQTNTGILDIGVNTASTLATLYGWGATSTAYTSVSNAATWFPMPSSVAVSAMNTTNTNGQRYHFPILRNI